MIVCGIKLTHDASIAVIDNGKLIFSYEVEKFNNNSRHASYILTIDETKKLLRDVGLTFQDIDALVFDGWHRELHDVFKKDGVQMAIYGSTLKGTGDVMADETFWMDKLNVQGKSYKHVAGHIIGSYCSSPFAKAKEDSFLLVWDGGMLPQLFYYRFKDNTVTGIKELFSLTSHIYSLFAHHVEPFNANAHDVFSSPGKIMAFSSLGSVQPGLLQKFEEQFENIPVGEELSMAAANQMNNKYASTFAGIKILNDFDGPDILCTFQQFLADLLVRSLRSVVSASPGLTRNLCFSGGAALNIVWNSAIRESQIFKNVWVPPFPNDSGSAIGAACCEMIKHSNQRAIEWSVYSGNRLSPGSTIDPAWESHSCSVEDLALLLHQHGEPVVFLNDNAELGPRALGNRSILAPATDIAMKHLLNHVKERESYRPVAPICREEDAPIVFTPGTPDPYMLFTHYVKPEWMKRIPAVCHLDGTARLQTVNRQQNPTVHKLLTAYKKLSDVPLLCNTSANFKGKGFFPDVESAIQWGKVNLIWSNDQLYMRKGYSKFLYKLKKQKAINASVQ